jgi:predicted secreted acid phosphatase
MSIKKEAVIVDIDGTISNNSHRVHLVSGKSKNWPAFSELMDKDLPIIKNINRIANKYGLGYRILFVSGRSHQYRKKTEKWLLKYFYTDEYLLFLRKDNDKRPSFEIKRDILKQLRKKFIIKYVIDDNKKDLEMYEKEGLKTINAKDL